MTRRPLPAAQHAPGERGLTVFSLTTGSDTAGWAIQMKRGFDRHAPGWRFRAMVASGNYIDYPVDVPYSRDELERLYDAADVVQLHSTLHGHRWYDDGQGKPTALIHHGMHSREEYAEIAAEARAARVVQFASTLDLALLEPDVEWIPVPYDLAAMRAIRAEHYRPSDNVLRIAHAPTDRGIKGTEAFLVAMDRLAKRYPVEPVLIEGVPWAECLRLKATADVFFDQPNLGYGCNAVEAWAMGIPVVAGVSDPAIRAGMAERWDGLPFVEAGERTLYAALKGLIESPEMRREWAARGTAHVERWHGDARVVPMLESGYRSAGPTVPGTETRRLRRARTYHPISFWREAGRRYEAEFETGPAYEAQEQALMALLEGLRFRSVLEVGCGFGRITRLIAGRWPDVAITALDLSPDQLAATGAKVPGAELVESTFEDFDPGARRWDLVLASEFLMHVPPESIAEVVAKLRDLTTRDVVTVDWAVPYPPERPIADFNFCHDYAALYGEGVEVVDLGTAQRLYHVKTSARRRKAAA